VCITHRLYCKDTNCTVAGVISALVDENQDDENTVDDCVTSGGVIEFKPKTFDTVQIFNEMLKSAGDLAVKVLMEGEIIDHIIMYGLAANFKECSAKLTILQLDFLNQKVVATESVEPIDMKPGY